MKKTTPDWKKDFPIRGEVEDFAGKKRTFVINCYERDIGYTIRTEEDRSQGTGYEFAARLVGHVRFREGLPPTYGDIAIAQWVEAHPEKWLLGAAFLKLEELGLARVDTESDKFVVLAALNLVEGIAHAKKDV